MTNQVQNQNQSTRAQTIASQPRQESDFERLLEKKSVSYIPFGGQDQLKLNCKNVQELIAVKTKSGKTCTEQDALKFMAMCQALRLNPYAGDAFMVGYDTQDGPKFSLITAHAAFLKRAEVHPQYDGMESGIILMADGGQIEERQGDFHLPDEQVVGGWAKVYCTDRSHPTYRRLRMARFNKGFGIWKDDPAGMIVKCAEADALRSTFPTMVGGLYLREEVDFMPDAGLSTSKPLFDSPLKDKTKLVDVTPVEEIPAEHAPEKEKGVSSAEPTTLVLTPQRQLMEYVTGEGHTFEEWQWWAMDANFMTGADSIGSFDEVPEAEAKRCLNAKTGLKKGLAKARQALEGK
jgi:phage recombination protein Bet